ncbi:DUF946 domain-containing protein [Metarhizium guizhouense ARSEF 977]|uniref:DUF946 domain-containing protein n=1 Tax=Metarhizium guizhouense (strain ARSEF 977) TaxID=1276136 RepID=A0A0B4G6W1_METGA|nr:DUF946 domain-containing protein [Metarhizium guizhouense ARSEF 977]
MSDQQSASELVTKITASFTQRWNDAGSGASRNGGFWHPNSDGEFRPVGSVGVGNHKDINGSYSAVLIAHNPAATQTANAEGMYESPLASPIGYTQIWTDAGSKAKKNGSFWRPIPPNGYVALGDVAQNGWLPAPSVGDVWCVRRDLAVPGSFGSPSVWDDKKSGSKKDVSVWEIKGGYGNVEPAVTRLGAIRASETSTAPSLSFAVVPDV